MPGRPGCRCEVCEAGTPHKLLSEYDARERSHLEAQISRALDGTATLHVVTPSPPEPQALETEKPCTGAMTCACKRCKAERAVRVRRGGKGAGARQPWQPRPARARVAA